MARRRARTALALTLALAACAPPFPPRGSDVDVGGEAIVCPDFRDARVAVPWEILRAPALPSHTTPFGCPNARSLRVMVDDPADLAGGTTGPARSATAGPAVERYVTDAIKMPADTSTLKSAE